MKFHSCHEYFHGGHLETLCDHPPPFTPVGTRMVKGQGWQHSPLLSAPAEATGPECPSMIHYAGLGRNLVGVWFVVFSTQEVEDLAQVPWDCCSLPRLLTVSLCQ